MQRTAVLVVGGGLVGLSAAVFLAGQGVDVVLAERRPGTSIHPRARGLNIRTMELYREAGLEQSIRDTASARTLAGNNGICVLESLTGAELAPFRPGHGTGRTDGVDLPSPTGWCLCDQDEVEPLLAARARELGADLRFATELTDLTEDEDGVLAHLRGADGDVVLRADYVIAADGVGGGLRERAGIGVSGPGTLGHTKSVYFRADLRAALGDRRFVLCYLNNAEVRGVLAPVDNAFRWLLHVPCFPGRDGDEEFGDARCTELVRAATGIADLDVELLQVLSWESAGRVAERFRSGRLFLAGDAAHVMPPSGAFGSNTGIQDAHNLAWRLALVLQGKAAPALLDAYDAERRPVAEATVAQAVLRSKERPRLGREAAAIDETAIMSDQVVQLGYRYPTSGESTVDDVWTPSQTGEPGTRAPHVWLGSGPGRVSTLDVADGAFALLVAAPDRGWAEAADLLRKRDGLPVRPVVIGGEHGLADDEDRFAAAFGLEPGGAVLVRPDGFVAWRSETAEQEPVDSLRTELSGLLGHLAVS